MMESKIIESFEEFRALVSDKAKEGCYFLLYDDIYFERIGKNKTITREIFTVAERYAKSFNVTKYLIFNTKGKYKTKQLFEFVELLRKNIRILLTIYNPYRKECFLLFIGNKNDSSVTKEVRRLLEMED